MNPRLIVWALVVAANGDAAQFWDAMLIVYRLPDLDWADALEHAAKFEHRGVLTGWPERLQWLEQWK